MLVDAVQTVRLRGFPNLLIVQVVTSEQAVGVGDTFFGAAAVEAAVHEIVAPRILGTPIQAGAPPVVTDDRRMPAHGTSAERRALSAVDIALWDLHAQERGVPLSVALGSRIHDALPAYNTCAGPEYLRSGPDVEPGNWGLARRVEATPFDDLQGFLARPVDLAKNLLDHGIGAMKIWPFDSYAEASRGQWITGADLAEGLRPFRLIQDALGESMQLLVEMHGLWSVSVASTILESLEEVDPVWVEDPVRPDNLRGLGQLAQGTSCRLAGGETLGGAADHLELVESGALQTVIADVGWVGGLSVAREIGLRAAEGGLGFALHNCGGPAAFAASLHLAVTLGSVSIQETIRSFEDSWYGRVVDDWPRIVAGQIAPGTGPGLGVRVHPELLSRPDAVVRRTGSDG